jgi:hypothetical protein
MTICRDSSPSLHPERFPSLHPQLMFRQHLVRSHGVNDQDLEMKSVCRGTRAPSLETISILSIKSMSTILNSYNYGDTAASITVTIAIYGR